MTDELHLDELLAYLKEDVPAGDVTSDAVIPEVSCTAVIRAEHEGIIAGVAEAAALFSHFGLTVVTMMNDGDAVKTGDVILRLTGRAKAVLLVERTALNIMGRMSGIASATHTLSGIVRSINPSCKIAGTRKTSPGFRRFDKKAVVIGGGDPHRRNLSDGILIKDNHLAVVPLVQAIRAARMHSHYKKIEVEVESASDAVCAAEIGADIIMLDNMTPAQAGETVVALVRRGLREKVTLEISGGINEDTLRDYAACGVDVISMGALTHTVKNFSLSLEILPA